MVMMVRFWPSFQIKYLKIQVILVRPCLRGIHLILLSESTQEGTLSRENEQVHKRCKDFTHHALLLDALHLEPDPLLGPLDVLLPVLVVDERDTGDLGAALPVQLLRPLLQTVQLLGQLLNSLLLCRNSLSLSKIFKNCFFDVTFKLG